MDITLEVRDTRRSETIFGASFTRVFFRDHAFVLLGEVKMHGLTIDTGVASNLSGDIPLRRFLDFLKEKWPGQHTPVEKKQSPQSFTGISSESLPVKEEWYVPGFLGS